MLAILAEDSIDADVLACLVRRIRNEDRLRIKRKGYGGCGKLCKAGSRDIMAWRRDGIHSFIICHDADRNDPRIISKKVHDTIITPASLTGNYCVAVPVQEIEAWLIADENAINHVIPTFKFRGHKSPESITSPKEWLIRASSRHKSKPLYATAFNPSLAASVRLTILKSKCPSFRAFSECVEKLSW